MSDPLWINAASDTSVGTATIDSATDLFTIAAHGLANGERVVVSTLTGGASTLLAEGGVYWVVEATVNDFGVSLTQNGIKVDFAANGGADVNRFQPGHTAEELRRAQSGLVTSAGTLDRFGARQGILAAVGAAVTLSGTTWTVRDLPAVVYPGISDQHGPYVVAHPEEVGSLNAPDGTNPRIDALDLQIQDDDADASGFRRARVVYVVGTPAPSPSAPSVSANSLRLAEITVPQSGGGAATLEEVATYTAANGGIIPVRDDTQLPGIGQASDGTVFWHLENEELLVHSGTAIKVIGRANLPVAGWTPIDSGSNPGSAFTVDTTAGGKFPAGTFSRIRITLRGHLDGIGTVRLRVNDIATSIYRTACLSLQGSNGAVAAATQANAAPQWILAHWAGTTGNTCTATLYNTDVSALVGYDSQGGRMSSSAGMWISHGWGRIEEVNLVSSVNIRPFSDAANQFGSLDWSIEGYRE